MAKQLDRMVITTSYIRNKDGTYTQTDLSVQGVASDPDAATQGDQEPRTLTASHIFSKAQTLEEVRDDCLVAIKAKWAIT